MNVDLSDRANEAAHEAVLELLRASDIKSNTLVDTGRGKAIAANLIDLHRDLAAYYQGLDQEE